MALSDQQYETLHQADRDLKTALEDHEKECRDQAQQTNKSLQKLHVDIAAIRGEISTILARLDFGAKVMAFTLAVLGFSIVAAGSILAWLVLRIDALIGP